MGNPGKTLDGLHRLLAGANETYAQLPPNVRLEIDKVTQGLAELGPRLLRRPGPGMEFLEGREFNEEIDERRHINARLSARARIDPATGQPREIVAVREAEIRQHVYLWRDATPSMDVVYDKNRLTKKQASEIMLLALARHLAKNDEMVGVLDARGMYRGSNAHGALSSQLMSVAVLTGDMPVVHNRLPPNSTAILFSDCCIKPEILARHLDRLKTHDLGLHLVMVLDPQEIDFNYKGHVKFTGAEGEAPVAFAQAQALRSDYLQKMQDHFRSIQDICNARRIQLTVQRTDAPLHHALLSIYGLRHTAPDRQLKPEGP